MSAVDDLLKTAGEPCTIIRNSGNVSTYFYTSPKDNWNKGAAYERNVIMPTTSTVVGGDIIQHRSDYYIVINTLEDRRVGEFFLIKARYYKCNSTVTVRSRTAQGDGFQDFKTGVRCLITQTLTNISEDRSMMIPRYTGRDKEFYCFVSSTAGITKNHILVDQGGKKYRVMDDIDFTFADGVVRLSLKWENS